MSAVDNADKGQGTSTSWDELPAVVTTYLVANRDRTAGAAIGTFAQDAVVVDEGRTYRGHGEIRRWLGRAAGEYTYTTECTGAARTGEASFDVAQRLEGDFPGGVADLHFRFTLDGASISRLVIEP